VVTPPIGLATVKCVVPKLKRKSLAQATKALKRAHCKLGTVTKPKRKKGRKLPPLVVSSSSPKAGKVLAARAKVKLTLVKKPKPRKRR
jgi:beta-lactam-binding protein with PASTA domain